MPNVLSPRDLVFRPDIMDETVKSSSSLSKNMSVGIVCIKRFKFACMTILSPETVSLVLCQWSIADMQVPPVPNQHKNAEILAQNALKMQIEATIYLFFSGEIPPNPLTRVAISPLVLSPSTGRGARWPGG